MRREDDVCPQMRKGMNEGALEVSGAREKSEAKQVSEGMRQVDWDNV